MKLSPQPHSPLMLGFWKRKASFSPCLTKSTIGAVDELQAHGIDEHLDAPVLEHQVVGLRIIGVVDDVGEAGAAGLAHAQSAGRSPCPRAARKVLTRLAADSVREIAI